MKAYSELYLDDAMSNLGDMVDYAVCDLGYDGDTFFDWFLTSGVADGFGKGNPKYVAGMSGYELAHTVLDLVNVSHDRQPPSYPEDRSPEYWVGWILAYYQWLRGESFDYLIHNGLNYSTVLSMYLLHEADESKFAESADQIIKKHQENSPTNLSKIRKARGFTQQKLSEASGVSLRMIQLYEQRQNDITKAQVGVVIRLARALGCKVEDILI